MIVSVNQELIKSYQQLSPQDVPLSMFLTRVNNLGWDIQRAAQTPYKPRAGGLVAHYKHLYDRIESPVVGFDVFCRRLRNGWDVHKAATTAKVQTSKLHEYYHQYKAVPAVKYRTFFNRVCTSGWSLEKAITTPPVRQVQTQAKVRSSCFLACWFNKNIERAQVSWNCFCQRVRKGGWDKERALTTVSAAVRQSRLRSFYKNHPNPAVNYMTFHRRVYTHGWEMSRAITTPVRGRRRSAKERVTL